jgi:hypothetical protein
LKISSSLDWTYGKLDNNGSVISSQEKGNIVSAVLDCIYINPDMIFGQLYRLGDNIEYRLDMPETTPVLTILARKRHLVERIEINFSVQN